MKTVSAREATQGFSKLRARAAAGEEVVITRRGTPVAKLVPIPKRKTDRKRQAAIKRMIALMQKGMHLGGVRYTRDQMHER